MTIHGNASANERMMKPNVIVFNFPNAFPAAVKAFSDCRKTRSSLGRFEKKFRPSKNKRIPASFVLSL